MGGFYKKWAGKPQADKPMNLDIQIGHDADEMFQNTPKLGQK
jgi:hypothetical protein